MHGQEFYIAQSCRWKGKSLNCPETRWREVEDSYQSRRVTTCTTGKAVSDEIFDGADDGESTTILQASGRGSQLRFRKSPAVPATDRRYWRGDCASLQPTVCVWEYFVTPLKPLIWQRVCRCVYYFGSLCWRDTVVYKVTQGRTFIDWNNLIHCY